MRVLFLGLLLTMLIFAPSVQAEVGRPNVILIFADDISARELPVYGSSVWSGWRGENTTDRSKRAETPVLDRLAREGAWFTQTWAATVCSPSRAMMMTGRYASLHKWWHNGDYGMIEDEKGRKHVRPLYDSSPLLIGHVARQAGYATLWVGKTQMKGADLTRFGFEEGVFTPGPYWKDDNPYNTDFKLAYHMVNGERKLVNLDTGKPVEKGYAQTSWYWKPSVLLMNAPGSSQTYEWWPNTPESRAEYGPGTYGPDVEMQFSLSFMERAHRSGRPFFIYHTSHLGHDAFNWIDPESEDKWPGTPIVEWDGQAYTRTEPYITGDNGDYDTHGTITDTGIHHHINYLDYQVWVYLQKLKELGIENDTILIFAADNGTSGYGKASPDRQKGTHVPLIVYAPGMRFTKQGKQDQLVSIADMLPTLADIAGVEIPADYEVHGESLWPYLTTGKQNHRDWIYAYKSEKQLIRGRLVMRDGYGKWWDVSTTPDDLISFRQIRDWSKASPAHRAERDMLQTILPQFDVYETAHD